MKVVMPQLGMSMLSGFITEWVKKEGDMVEKDELLLKFETEKMEGEITAPVAGKLHILAEAETDVECGNDVCEIIEE